MTEMFKTLSHSNHSAKCSIPIDKKDDPKPVEESMESGVNSDDASFEPKPLARAKTSFFNPHVHSHFNYADGSKSDDEDDPGRSFSAPHHSKTTLLSPPSHIKTSTTPLTPPSTPSLTPHKIHHITTLSSLEAVLEEHYNRHVVIFCVLSTHKDPDVDEEGWYHHYERLNNVHFVRIDLETDTEDGGELEERLGMKGRGKPCWVTFHKGCSTGWASGGMKKFMRVHGGRGHANSI
jgi:hypothetical protein